ncbi:DUF1206 domain-containing protein [Deinococcus cellulosilyticus]|uniref:Membrane protein n=1 Tax=Deinococcus cellulosilyticus (strain DSM 18568 / NBRC 106333 / KACC 11606 / 5516J-15) TaxID=1223518 RepID=A0A511MV64_DEIC1|nr:DUF1206 domain-containing protein [Deinococcus cellulosilyticus]GEM44474.1 membrane protein [Deinococcus cellulosilyticus NBRC 106333 = KACC 11606]
MTPEHLEPDLKSDIKSHARKTKAQVEARVEEAAPWLVRLARFGYFCKGLMYLTIAFLAIRGALHLGNNQTDPRGALDYLGRNTASDALLITLAVGLVGYSIWQLIRAFVDPEQQGHKAKGMMKRIGYGISGIAYLTLAWAALRVSWLEDRVSNPQSEEQWVARIFEWPAGRELVAVVGVVFLAVALNQLYVAIRASFMKRIKSWHLKPQEQALVVGIGRIGIAARGLVAGMVGWLLLRAAWYVDASEAGGMSEALRNFEKAPGGAITFLMIAIGMLLYGLYAWIQARYRKIPIGQHD